MGKVGQKSLKPAGENRKRVNKLSTGFLTVIALSLVYGESRTNLGKGRWMVVVVLAGWVRNLRAVRSVVCTRDRYVKYAGH